MLQQLHRRIEAFLFDPPQQPLLSLASLVLRYPYALIRDVLHGELTLRAMSLVYTTLLSLAPLMALAFSVLKGLGYGQYFQPMLYQFLQPLGHDKATELTTNMMSTINSVRSGVLGSLGLALLIYYVISTVQKVEESFNFVWRVEQPRSLTRRFTEYLSVMTVGPLLLAAAIGVFGALSRSDAAQTITHLGFIAWIANHLKHLTPMLLVSAAFSFVYGFIPNTKVRIRTALIGGVTAGALWTAGGVLFTRFVASSTQTALIYAGFAIVIVALIWIYVSWLILLIGAQLTFYVQHPQSLRHGHRDVSMTPELLERIALSIMYLIGYHFKHDDHHWNLSRLSRHLDIPVVVLRPIVNALIKSRLLVATEDDALVPARDLAHIHLHQILDAVRDDHRDDGHAHVSHLRTLVAADEIAAQIRTALHHSLHGRTLAEWTEQSPVTSLLHAGNRH
ncbi:MAG: YihY/virulence factor BrkB family protein [Steroidobacter sp.]